jgi:hypothetical protein
MYDYCSLLYNLIDDYCSLLYNLIALITLITLVIWVAFLSLLYLSPRLSLYVSSLCSLSLSSLHLLCLFTPFPISLLASSSMSLHSLPFMHSLVDVYMYLVFTLTTLFSHLTHALFPLITPSRGAVRRYAIKDSGSMLLVVDPDRLARVSPLIGKIGFKTILCRSDATASGYAATATAGGERVSEACIHGIVASSHQ